MFVDIDRMGITFIKIFSLELLALVMIILAMYYL